MRNVMLIVIFGLLMLYPVLAVFSQASGTTVAVIPSAASPQLGQTLKVNITVTNVQNLYAVDVILLWNTSALNVLKVDSRLGVESFPDGVLHNDIQFVQNDSSQDTGECHLVATSVAPAAAFSGSGNIVIISFNVTALGHSDLVLQTQLADFQGGSSNSINHTDLNGTVDSSIPEFPSVAVFALFLLLVTLTLVVSRRLMKRNVFDGSLTQKL